MKNFVIVTNAVQKNSLDSAQKITAILERNGCRCSACIIAGKDVKDDHPYLYTDPALVPDDTEAVLSLGGDGTFIHTCKDLLKLQLPVFGINFGTLGYMTEVSVDGFEDALKEIIRGNIQIEERMLLSCDMISDGEIMHKGLAFNDIVLQRSLDAGIAQYDVKVDGQYLNTYSADGMIISTPTGSTGYNLSAGGPVVLPTAQIVLATPICAHTLNSRSIVLPANVTIEIFGRTRDITRNAEIYVTIDGEKGIRLRKGDSICASKAEGSAKILKINEMSFIEQLGKKMR